MKVKSKRTFDLWEKKEAATSLAEKHHEFMVYVHCYQEHLDDT